MSHESKRPVTLEDVIRLKRSEQPPAEFWDGFERELRAKQLAALVEKRPWWERLPQVSFAWRRNSLSLGAMGALAIALVAVRHYQSSPAPAVEPGMPSGPTIARVETNVSVPEARLVNSSNQEAMRAVRAAVEEKIADATPAAGNAGSVAADFAGMPSVTPLLGVDALVASVVEESSAARHSAPSFATVSANESVISGGLLAALPTPEAPVAATRPARVEPLSQMSLPTETQARSRLRDLAIATVASYRPSGPSDDVTERQARTLNHERIYEAPKSRFSATGNSVSIGVGRSRM